MSGLSANIGPPTGQEKFRCRRCGTVIRQSRAHCPCCGSAAENFVACVEQPVPTRATSQVTPAQAPVTQAAMGETRRQTAVLSAASETRKVACALCLNSCLADPERLIDPSNAQVAAVLSAEMTRQHQGQTVCEECLEGFRKKAGRMATAVPSAQVSDSQPAAKAPSAPAPALPASDGQDPVANKTAPPAQKGRSAVLEPKPVANWILGGLAGGALGTAIWLADIYLWDYLHGLLVLLMGVLVGIGVRIGAQGSLGPGPGLVAVGITLLAGFSCNYLKARKDFQELSGGEHDVEQALIEELAGEVAEEWSKAGRQTTREAPQDSPQPQGGQGAEEEEEPEDPEAGVYTEEVYTEARQRFENLPAADREQRRKGHEQEYAQAASIATLILFLLNWRILFWTCIACGSAFKIGAGNR